MPEKVFVARAVSWPAMVATATFPASIAVLTWAVAPSLSAWVCVAVGVFSYFALGSVARSLWMTSFPRGMELIQDGNYAGAIPHFQAAYDFFSQHPRLDAARGLLFLNPSRFSYREVALANIGFCYIKLGDGAKAVEFYQRVVSEFPGTLLGKNALDFARALSSRSDNCKSNSALQTDPAPPDR